MRCEQSTYCTEYRVMAFSFFFFFPQMEDGKSVVALALDMLCLEVTYKLQVHYILTVPCIIE